MLDASGRETFLASRMKIKRRNTKHASAACMVTSLTSGLQPGEAEGNISIFWFDHGWFWFIPLRRWHHQCRRGLLASLPEIPPFVANSVSARNDRPVSPAGGSPQGCAADRPYDRYRQLFVHLRPHVRTALHTDRRCIRIRRSCLFSGVYLAMNSASVAAEALNHCLDNPRLGAVHFAAVDRRVRRGLRTFQWLIYRMTSPAMRHLFMNPNDQWGIQSAVISLLAGDVYGKREVDRRLRLFRGIYYLVCIRFLPQSLTNGDGGALPLRIRLIWWRHGGETYARVPVGQEVRALSTSQPKEHLEV